MHHQTLPLPLIVGCQIITQEQLNTLSLPFQDRRARDIAKHLSQELQSQLPYAIQRIVFGNRLVPMANLQAVLNVMTERSKESTSPLVLVQLNDLVIPTPSGCYPTNKLYALPMLVSAQFPHERTLPALQAKILFEHLPNTENIALAYGYLPRVSWGTLPEENIPFDAISDYAASGRTGTFYHKGIAMTVRPTGVEVLFMSFDEYSVKQAQQKASSTTIAMGYQRWAESYQEATARLIEMQIAWGAIDESGRVLQDFMVTPHAVECIGRNDTAATKATVWLWTLDRSPTERSLVCGVLGYWDEANRLVHQEDIYPMTPTGQGWMSQYIRQHTTKHGITPKWYLVKEPQCDDHGTLTAISPLHDVDRNNPGRFFISRTQ